MRRREFIGLVGSAAVWPFAVHAQQPATRPLIGVLSALSPTAAKRNVEGLREGLRALGYVEGHNILLELRFAEGVVARLPELASDLVTLKPDVILAGSLSSILAARNATTTIPLIFLVIEDPVALGLVSSITKPGGHITGVWMFGDDSNARRKRRNLCPIGSEQRTVLASRRVWPQQRPCVQAVCQADR
jgi:putative ABC transport system substrate-binding protein